MVMKLDLPKVVHADMIDAIVDERQGGINAAYFTGIREAWKARVLAYVEAGGNPEVIQPWPNIAQHKTKLKSLYLNAKEGSTQKLILDELRSRKLQLCPACGEDGTPNTLDHYLPKETYPEFSILPANLSPMCDACQGEKSSKTLDEDSRRLFLHPYFDQIQDLQLVQFAIGQPFDAPETIELTPHVDLDAALAALVVRHLAELGISKRYHRFFRDEYMKLLRLVQHMRTRQQSVRDNLELFRDYAYQKSVNSWLHIFYTGVLANEDLLVYLEGGVLASFR
jgi:hypothetical protein